MRKRKNKYRKCKLKKGDILGRAGEKVRKFWIVMVAENDECKQVGVTYDPTRAFE